MRLNELRPPVGQTHKVKRVARGMGSGGRRGGRGDKGQKSRSGYSRRLGFEGGQNPLIRRLPKRGFHNLFKKEFAIVNLDSLATLGDVKEITAQLLIEKGVIHKLHAGLRVLGGGEYTGKAVIHANHFSESAEKKIVAAGGKAEWIGGKPEPKPEPKKPEPKPAAPAKESKKEEAAPEAKAEKKQKAPKEPKAEGQAPAGEKKPKEKKEKKGPEA